MVIANLQKNPYTFFTHTGHFFSDNSVFRHTFIAANNSGGFNVSLEPPPIPPR